jgi:hypothetical protein
MRKYLLLSFLLLAFVDFSHSSSKQTANLSNRKSYKTVFAAATWFGEPASGKLNAENFEDSVQVLYNAIGLEQYGLAYDIFRKGIIGYHTLKSEGSLSNESLLTIIDFSQPSTSKRFYTIDLENHRLKFNTLVAHGRNTGENLAKHFSNKQHSNQSSLGFYVTGETYVGSKGYSLRLDGKEKNYNDKIRARAVVIHDAEYVSENWINRYGRLGRSQGCPALPKEISRKVINTIKNKTAVFAYYPDQNYLTSSRYLRVDQLMDILAKASQPKSAKQI